LEHGRGRRPGGVGLRQFQGHLPEPRKCCIPGSAGRLKLGGSLGHELLALRELLAV
jgi:hypothetical protein